MSSEYDSAPDTYKHIQQVQYFLNRIIQALMNRGEVHDQSKLGPDEKPHFDRETPLLKELVYGSPEYKESLGRLGEALRHHYKNNKHHPEHHENGVAGMNLIDLVEMFADWCAASQRTAGGKLDLETSFNRFHFDPQLAQIFRNTAEYLHVETK